MYQSDRIIQKSEDCFDLKIETSEFKILQLTDIHFGFSVFSRKKDEKAKGDIQKLIEITHPDFIAITGDSIFPYLPKSGTRDNIRQAHKFIEFFDGFKIPYSLVFGNHDIEMGSKGSKDEIATIFESGKYSVFSKGRSELTGMGNYQVNLVNSAGNVFSSLIFLDSNMYRDGWFYSGFDCIREDQTKWCMESLRKTKNEFPDCYHAFAFFHMPLPEFKEAYRRMKLGDPEVQYHFGSIGEEEDYFGISKYQPDFFEAAVDNGLIRGIFCGHDHLNTLSLTFKNIRMTYGMSIDYLGYKHIGKRKIQRGGTLITLEDNGEWSVKPIPLNSVVSTFVRGIKSQT